MGGNVARLIERRFAIFYIAFAAAFGGFAARGYAVVDAELHALLVALVFGYGAGVAATVSLRPRISISSILIAIVPMILASLFQSGAAYGGTGLLATLFLAGGAVDGSALSRNLGADLAAPTHGKACPAG